MYIYVMPAMPANRNIYIYTYMYIYVFMLANKPCYGKTPRKQTRFGIRFHLKFMSLEISRFYRLICRYMFTCM